MAQLSYPRTMPVGFAGMKSSSVDDTVDTGVSEETAAPIPFGCVVAQGSGQDGVKLPAASGDAPVGICIHDYAANLDATRVGVDIKSPVNVLRVGRCWVVTEDAVTPASKVYYRHTANGGNTQKGSIRGSTATGAVELFGAQFKGSAAGGGLVELEVNFLTHRALKDGGL